MLETTIFSEMIYLILGILLWIGFNLWSKHGNNLKIIAENSEQTLGEYQIKKDLYMNKYDSFERSLAKE